MKEVYQKINHLLILQEYLLPLLFVLNSIFGGMTFHNLFAQESATSIDCCACHNDIYEASISKNYVHLPFLQKNCTICHVKINEAKGQPPQLMEIPGQLPHLAMRDFNELSISVCTQCHHGFANAGNHPLKNHNFLKVTIPASYSTDSDGSLTCITCHANHASDFEFRTIKSRKKALCVGCHKGYPAPMAPPSFSLIRRN